MNFDLSEDQRMMRESFARYGIQPASAGGAEEGIWRPAQGETQ